MEAGLRCILALAVSAAASSVFAAGGYSAYHIGNSLSEDMWRVFPVLAADYQSKQVPASTYSWGAHFRAGTSLTYMYNNPAATDTLSAVGLSGPSNLTANTAPWNTALPGNNWNAVTMEPYPSYNEIPGSVTLATDTTSVNGMITSAKSTGKNASTKFFVYGAWPSVTFGNYSSYSTAYLAAPTFESGNTSENSALSRTYFKNLTDSVRVNNPSVSLIPVGEVLFKIDEKMRAGGTFSSNFNSIEQLHRDTIHLNGLGQNVAAATVYACLFKKDPTGLSYQTMWPDQDASLSSHLPAAFRDADGKVAVNDPVKMAALQADLRLMQQTVWEVVNSPEMINYTSVPEPTASVMVLGGMTVLGMRWRAAK